MLGTEVQEAIFPREDPLGKDITVEGLRYRVVGVLEKKGAQFGWSPDNKVVVPYGAILYDANGVPSVFTNPDPRVYIRHPVQVDRISGSVAYLRKGLAAGESVVTVGGDELYGAETGVQGEER